MKQIALKIDVDTLHGTRLGVPALLELLHQHQAQGSFFFSLGPDQSGCQPKITSLKRYYPLKTRLQGRALPAPDIGKACREIFNQVQRAGFETGVHGWNRTAWEERITDAENAWAESEMCRATARFAEIFSENPKACAAPGWRSNRHALRLTQRLGYSYASDCRGSHPFIPVIDGEIVACPQLSTTLPTLDEILALEPGLSADQAADRILQLAKVLSGDHVFTLRAELEGTLFTDAFTRLLTGWRETGFALVALRDIRSTLEINALPRHTIHLADIPGRLGKRMIQGPAFPLEG